MNRAPAISISRLALYVRFLEDFARERARTTINSEELARGLDMNPHQIRKDLSYFGKFGARGIGYNIAELTEKINDILGLRKPWRLCLCGLGNLGSALTAYRGFRQMNLNIVAIFDSDPQKIGTTVQGIKVSSTARVKTVVQRLKIDIAIIAVPTDAAQGIADQLTKVGIRAILNFAPVKLIVPQEVKLRNVDLATDLINLTHFLSSRSKTLSAK